MTDQTLLLFDIDGTLMRGAAEAQTRALHLVLEEIHGLKGSRDVEIQTSGRTDLEIARMICAELGVPDDTFTERNGELADRWVQLHDDFCVDPLHEQVLRGVPETLEVLSSDAQYRISLVTGNLEAIAWRKLEQTGLDGFFERGQGGFGSDHEIRERLPEIARERASDGVDPWPRDQTVVIGDTPRDIACARADEVAVIAVTTGVFPANELFEADLVVSEASELPDALARLRDS